MLLKPPNPLPDEDVFEGGGGDSITLKQHDGKFVLNLQVHENLTLEDAGKLQVALTQAIHTAVSYQAEASVVGWCRARTVYQVPHLMAGNLKTCGLEQLVKLCVPKNRYKEPINGDRVFMLEGATWVTGTVRVEPGTIPCMETENFVFPFHVGANGFCQVWQGYPKMLTVLRT